MLGVSDAGTRLLFKFRSGTHGLNEEFKVGIEGEKVGHNVCCVMMNVRVLLMCCRIVQHIILLERVSWKSFHINFTRITVFTIYIFR